MSCNICYTTFNRTLNLPKVLPCCSRSICSSCCMKIDRERTKTCPFCKATLFAEFMKLNKNFDLIERLPEWNATKCKQHDKLNELMCEDCQTEICTKCIEAHNKNGHSIIDIDDFLNEMKNKQKDYKLWITKTEEKCQLYDKMTQLRKDMLKNLAKKKFEDRIALTQKFMEQAMMDIDDRFKNLDLKFLYSEGTMTSSVDVRQVLKECKEMTEHEENEEISQKILTFSKLNRLPVLKNWSEKDEMETLKSYLSRIDFEFAGETAKPYQIVIKDLTAKERTMIHIEIDEKDKKTCVISDNSNSELFWNEEKRYLIYNFKDFELQDIRYSSQLLPISKHIKHLKLNIPDETYTVEEQSSFLNDFLNFENLETLELMDSENSDIDFIYMICEVFEKFRFLKALNIEGNYNYSQKDINFILFNINAEKFAKFGLRGQSECTNNMTAILTSLKKFKKLEELTIESFGVSDQENITGLSDFVTEMKNLTALDLKFIIDSKRNRFNTLSFKKLFSDIIELPNLSKLAINPNNTKSFLNSEIDFLDDDILVAILNKNLKELKLTLPEGISKSFFAKKAEIFDYALGNMTILELTSCGSIFLDTYGNFLQAIGKHKEHLEMKLRLRINPNELEYFASNFLNSFARGNLALELKTKKLSPVEGTIIERLKRVHPTAKINVMSTRVFHRVDISL